MLEGSRASVRDKVEKSSGEKERHFVGPYMSILSANNCNDILKKMQILVLSGPFVTFKNTFARRVASSHRVSELSFLAH